MERQATKQYAGRLRALILAGSLARNEATVIEEQGRWRCLGDAEFVLVFRKRVQPTLPELERLARGIEARLQQRSIFCRVFVGTCRARDLRKLRPGVFAYELRTHGQVIWGDKEVLSLVPDFADSDIPREDAWRMLCNRMIEQLEAAAELGLDSAPIAPRASYQTVKLYLDMATSLLVFAGMYRPSYRERAEQLRWLAQDGSGLDYPFSLRPFSERVAACTRFKLEGSAAGQAYAPAVEPVVDAASWIEAVAYARLLWRWELARLTRAPDRLSDRQLLERWVRLQTARSRVRGWLYVLRAQGWHRSWRNWRRWARLAWRASPRYCVYAAASRSLGGLPAALDPSAEPSNAEVDWDAVRSCLPLVERPGQNPAPLAWQRVASEIAWNYHQFLEGTQA